MSQLQDTRNSDTDELFSLVSETSTLSGTFVTPEQLLQRQGIHTEPSFYSSRSLRINRFIFRPLAIFILGFFFLRAKENRSSSSVFLHDFNLSFHNSTSFKVRMSPEVTTNANPVSSLPKQQFHPPYWPRNLPPHSSPVLESDPQTYGWEPSIYPDPMYESHKCGIAYILEDDQYVVNDASLRLCDPDWILGGIYLEQIAISMENFMINFSNPPEDQSERKIEEETGQPANVTNDDNDNGDAGKNTQLIIDAASSNDVSAQEMSRPYVELGVATVRKVRFIPYPFYEVQKLCLTMFCVVARNCR